MKGKDVYITAAGMMSALGDSVDSLGLALETGCSAPKLDEKTDKDIFGGTLTATIEGFRAAPFLKNRKNLKLMSRSVQLGMAALKKCYDATQFNGPELSPDRFGLVVGAGSAIGQNKDLIPVLRDARIDGQFSAEQFGALGMHAINPLWLLKGLSNNILGFASADFDARGFNQNYCNSGIAGLQAIGEGTWAIKEGRADRIIAGGADAPVDIYHLAGFSRIKALSGAQTPDELFAFDKRRDGFVLGEGAAFFSLEPEGSVAKPLARVAGYAALTASKKPFEGDSDIVATCVERCLESAGLDRRSISGIIAHGNGSRQYDDIEARALYKVFGQNCPPVTSNKPQLGHTIAASGPLSVCAAIYAGQNRRLPPVLNLSEPSESASLINCVSKEPKQLNGSTIMVLSAGIGGQVAAMILEVKNS